MRVTDYQFEKSGLKVVCDNINAASKRTLFSPIALVNTNTYVDRNSNLKMHRMFEIRYSFDVLQGTDGGQTLTSAEN